MFIKKRVGHPNTRTYQLIKGSVPGPGAENFGLERPSTLPMLTIEGLGTRSGSLHLLQTPQVYYNLQLPIAGLGGQQQGQFFSSPLLNSDLSPMS